MRRQHGANGCGQAPARALSEPQSGAPFQYMGHWSWLYTLNNECEDGGTTVMEWLAAQKK